MMNVINALWPQSNDSYHHNPLRDRSMRVFRLLTLNLNITQNPFKRLLRRFFLPLYSDIKLSIKSILSVTGAIYETTY